MTPDLLPIARYMHNLILMKVGKFSVIERATLKYNLDSQEAAEIYNAALVIFDSPTTTVQAFLKQQVSDTKRLADICSSLKFGGHQITAKLTPKNWVAIHRMLHRRPTISVQAATEIHSIDRCPVCNGRMERVTLATRREATFCPIHNVVFPVLPPQE